MEKWEGVALYSLEAIEKAIGILENVNWSAYGEHQADDYIHCVENRHSDEASLVEGLLGNFLEQVLGFKLHRDLLPQMTTQKTGKQPDYIPDDTHLHPFVAPRREQTGLAADNAT